VCLAVVVAALLLFGPRSSYGQSRRPATPVEIVNVPTAPVPVRDVDVPARVNYQTSAVITIDQPDFATVATFTVPAGKIFVVEFVSVLAQVPNGQRLQLTFFTGPVQHFFAPPFAGTDSAVDKLVLSQPTRMYHDTNVPLQLNATRFADNSGQAFAAVSVSGYLIDP
jgi:hypothetical protein